MISPALKLINSFKITCILMSPADKYRSQVFEKTELVQDSFFVLDVYFWLMIVGFGKIRTLTRDTHTDTRCLGRRLLLVGNIGFSRSVQTNTNFTKLIHYILQMLSYKHRH